MKTFLPSDWFRLRKVGFVGFLLLAALITGLFLWGFSAVRTESSHWPDLSSHVTGVSTGSFSKVGSDNIVLFDVDGDTLPLPFDADKPVPSRGNEVDLWSLPGSAGSIDLREIPFTSSDGSVVTFFTSPPGGNPRGAFAHTIIPFAAGILLLGPLFWVSLMVMLVGFYRALSPDSEACNWSWRALDFHDDDWMSNTATILSGVFSTLASGALSGLLLGFWLAPSNSHAPGVFALCLGGGVAVAALLQMALSKVWVPVARLWATRLFWGPRKTTRLTELRRPTGWIISFDWHARWLQHRKVDREVLAVLGDAFPGTLGDLIVASRELGPS